MLKNHFNPDGSCDCPRDGKCGECSKPCSDHDLVGNQTEFGFPVYWCGECINKHLDEDDL